MNQQCLIKRPASPNIISIIFSTIFLLVACCYQPASAAATPQVKTDKDIYHVGETIRVNFFNSPGNQRDWICIVAAGSPDNDAGDYNYLPHGVSQGVLSFDARPSGKYEVRAYYNYSRNGYVVSGRYSFSVVDMATPPPTPAAVPKPKEDSLKKSANAVGSFAISRLSVLNFNAINMEAVQYGPVVTDMLTDALGKNQAFSIISRHDLMQFLRLNDLQQNDNLGNMVNIGSRLGLNFIVAGRIEKKGMILAIECIVVNVHDEKVIFTRKIQALGDSNLAAEVSKISDSIAAAMATGSR